MEKSGSRPHRLEPLQSVVVSINFKRYGHQIRSELCDGPDDGETLQFGGGILALGLVKGSRGAADDTLFTFPDLSKAFCDSMPEVTGLSCCKGAFVRTKLEFCVPETLDNLAEAGEVLLSFCGEAYGILLREGDSLVYFPLEGWGLGLLSS